SQHRDGAGAELERAEQACNTTTDDDHVVDAVRHGGAFASSRAASETASVLQVHHALDRPPRPFRNHRIDHNLFFHVDETVEDLRQGDALHVRAEITGPHELDIGQFGLH